jgi:adenylate cyclase
MPYPEFHYRWQWHLRASPAALWPLVSDTNRFNRDTGLPSVEDRRAPAADLDNARRHLRMSRMGVPIEWEEEPFEWVRPQRFGIFRRYLAGPVATMRITTDLNPLPGGGTQVVYEVWARPKNALGLLAIPFQIGLLSARSFAATFRRYDMLAASARPAAVQQTNDVAMAPGGQTRLAELTRALISHGVASSLADHLVHVLQTYDDLAVSHLRPFALAGEWDAPRRAVLEMFLWATRLGLVDFQWELLCPLCRGAKQTAAALNGIAPQMHCEVCKIDFTVNFDRSVELTFRPNPAIRHVDVGAYCVGGPQVTPHIVAQQLLPAHAAREVSPALEPGRYRVRTLDLRGGQFLSIAPGGATSAALTASAEGWSHDEPLLALTPSLNLKNETDREQLFILEHMAWSDQSVTAAEVTTMQLFRDLFASEALRPDAQISVGSLTVLFTDLRDSTRLYRQIGDAVAFGRVMRHFDVLRDAIAAEDGAVVKTIGDSVMAVFRRPAPALRAIWKAQENLTHSSAGAGPLVLKAGLHHGPCIAVNLNDRLDYFGSTVNIAARIQNLSTGDDVVISSAIRDDTEVAQWLQEHQSTLAQEPFTATLKGIDEHFQLFRLTRCPSAP